VFAVLWCVNTHETPQTPKEFEFFYAATFKAIERTLD
jgi:hypothetical protein